MGYVFKRLCWVGLLCVEEEVVVDGELAAGVGFPCLLVLVSRDSVFRYNYLLSA
jgi:hypothetical protein